MADITAVAIDSNSFSENVVSKKLGLVTPFEYTVNSGTGTAVVELASVYGVAPTKVLSGMCSLKVNSTDYQNTDLVFSNAEAFSSDTPKNYFVSVYFQRTSATIDTTYRLEIFQDAVLYETIVFDLNSTNLPDSGQWYRLGQNVYFDSGYSYTFKHTLVKDASHPTNSITLYLGGFAIQCLNKGSQEHTVYSLPKDLVLLHTETIDVPSISANDFEIVTVTFTGAKVGDLVNIVSFPDELNTLGLIIGNVKVTNDDEVTFMVSNVSGGAHNPASGNYSFKIVR